MSILIVTHLEKALKLTFPLNDFDNKFVVPCANGAAHMQM